MTFDANVESAVIRIGTEFNTVRSELASALAGIVAITGDPADLDTTNKTNLVAAINEIFAGGGSGGGVTDLNGLSDVTLTSVATGHVLRYNGTQWVNVLGTTHFDAAGSAAAAQAAAIAASQPLDADLTTIAGQANTSYGLNLLLLANQAAFTALNSVASDSVAGIVELNTDAEAIAGTGNRAVTAANLAAVLADRIDTNTALGSSNTKIPSQAAVKAYADQLIGAANATVFKGVLDCSGNPNYPAGNAGDIYVISVAGKIGGGSGPSVEAGDQLLCLADGTGAGNHATVGSSWNVTQRNIDGAVTGPASSVSGNLASFNGTGGKVIQDAGVSVDTDGSLSANSDTRLATQKAVKTYAQPLDATLTALAGVSVAADKLIYATGSDTFGTTDITSTARSLLDDGSVSAMRTTLDVWSKAEIGSVTSDYVAAFEGALA